MKWTAIFVLFGLGIKLFWELLKQSPYLTKFLDFFRFFYKVTDEELTEEELIAAGKKSENNENSKLENDEKQNKVN